MGKFWGYLAENGGAAIGTSACLVAAAAFVATFVPGPTMVPSGAFTASLTVACVGDRVANGFTQKAFMDDAAGLTEKLNNFYEEEVNAGYPFCIVEGGSEAECTIANE